MKWYFSLLLLSSFSILTGCNTLGKALEGMDPGDLNYSPSIKIEPPSDPDGLVKGSDEKANTQISLNKWLWRKIEQHPKVTSSSSGRVACRESAGISTLLHCFSMIPKADKKIYRNNLVDLSIYLANKQCNHRIDGVGGYLAGGNTLESMATDIVGAVGVVSTDAITSRIASGVGVGVKSLWDNSKTNFIAGANFGMLTANIVQEREDQKELIRENMNLKKDYDIWPLEKALIAIEAYDNTCDLFN